MKTWPTLALRLLARILQQGARFLERQGQKIEHWAEQVSNPEAETSTGEDEPSSSSGGPLQTDRSPGEPPAHWLEKIEASEGPVQWIEHTGEDSPAYGPPPSPRSLHAAFPKSSRSRHEEGGASDHPDTGKQSARDHEHGRREGTVQQPPSTSDEESARITPSPRFEQPNEEAARGQARRSQQRDAEDEARGESAFDSFASRADSEAAPTSTSSSEAAFPRDRTRSSQLVRFQPRPSRNRSSEEERESAGEDAESVDPTPSNRGEQTSSDTARDAERVVSFPSAESEFGQRDVSEAGLHSPSSRPDSRREPSDSTRRLETQPPADRSTRSERVAFDWRHPASSLSSSRSSSAERSKRFPDSAADSAVNYRSHSASSLPKWEGEMPTARPPRSRWPDLPDVDRIVREEVSASRRWTRRMRRWERRQRLNREQRGQLWSA